MDVCEFIRKKVAETGSQTAIARKTGISQGTIAKICAGDTTPGMETISKIATAYGLPMSYFIDSQNKFKAFSETVKTAEPETHYQSSPVEYLVTELQKKDSIIKAMEAEIINLKKQLGDKKNETAVEQQDKANT